MPLLGDLVDIKGGGTPSRSVAKYWNGGIPWATVKDFKGTRLKSTQETISLDGLKNSASNLIESGCIILPSRMAVGKVAINTTKMAINQDLKALKIKDPRKVDLNYLFRSILSKAHLLERQSKGATVKGITLDVIQGIDISLPPLKEQKRIAAILDKADALRSKREKAIALTDELLRSVFLDMFGDPIINSKEWDICPFSKCVKRIVGGWSANGLARAAANNELGVLKISAVTSGVFKPFENKAVENVPKAKKLIFPRKGDLLFSRANTRELVAAMCIVEEDVDNLFLPDKLWRIDLIESKATSEYIKYLFSYPEFRKRLCEKATGTSGSMLNISKGKLVEHLIPIPPLDKQKIFSNICERAHRQMRQYNKAWNEANNLFLSLTQHAFRGEL